MKRLLILSAIVFLTGWAAALAQLHFWALKAESRPSENPMPANIAVVLGNSVNRKGAPNPCLRSRVEAGAALYRQGLAGGLLMSGGTDGDGSNEAEAMRNMAVSMGVPADKIRIEPRSESTYENIAFSAPLLHDAEQIVIVSDAFHLARAEWLAKRHWPGKTVRLHASGSCGDSTPNYLRKLSREILAWLKTAALHR